jgi:hypothetical protein
LSRRDSIFFPRSLAAAGIAEDYRRKKTFRDSRVASLRGTAEAAVPP